MEFLFPLSLLLLFCIPIIRLLLFLIDRFSESSLPPDAYVLMAWAERLVLMAVAALLLFLAIPGFVISIGIAKAFGPTPHANLVLVLFLPLALYLLAALVMNFPGFPFAWHTRLFWPVQFLLLSVIGLIPVGGILLLPPALLYASFWLLCLRDRQNHDA